MWKYCVQVELITPNVCVDNKCDCCCCILQLVECASECVNACKCASNTVYTKSVYRHITGKEERRKLIFDWFYPCDKSIGKLFVSLLPVSHAHKLSLSLSWLQWSGQLFTFAASVWFNQSINQNELIDRCYWLIYSLFECVNVVNSQIC